MIGKTISLGINLKNLVKVGCVLLQSDEINPIIDGNLIFNLYY